jgi:hypothetical protein
MPGRAERGAPVEKKARPMAIGDEQRLHGLASSLDLAVCSKSFHFKNIARHATNNLPISFANSLATATAPVAFG